MTFTVQNKSDLFSMAAARLTCRLCGSNPNIPESRTEFNLKKINKDLPDSCMTCQEAFFTCG